MAVPRIIAGITLAAIFFALHAGVASAGWTYDGVERVVAMSDIHGAYGAMVRTLQRADVIDDDQSWRGGKTHLVIVGDILDRGPKSRKAMDLLMRLEAEAAAVGGAVHVLIGNHEAMNLIGDLRYVAREEYAAFAIEESDEERQRWFEAWSAQRGGGEQDSSLRSSFDTRFPPGFFAHRRAFASDGKYGRWLLAKPIMIVINGTAFVHGGVSPMIADLGLDGVNGTLHGDMVQYVKQVEALVDAGTLLPTDNFYEHPQRLEGIDLLLTTDDAVAAAVKDVIRLNDSDLHLPDGPLWYRGNVACTEVAEVDRLEPALDAIGATRVVIGHTPTQGRRVLERLDGRVVEVDTGMLNSYYEGRGNALVLEGDNVSVINEGGLEWPAPDPHPRSVGRRPPGLDAAGIETLLAEGNVVADREDSFGRRIVSLSNGKQRVDAEFIRRSSRGFYPDVAAYRLDRMLELDMVPVAMKRKLDGRDGSLTFMPTGLINEIARRESGAGGGANCPLDTQWQAMMVFDALIFNEARFGRTIQYDKSNWQLILTGHASAFGTSKSRPRHLADVPLAIGTTWRAVLAALTEAELEEVLGDVIDSRRRRAMLARRDALLEAE